jgi:hypothetical protein
MKLRTILESLDACSTTSASVTSPAGIEIPSQKATRRGKKLTKRITESVWMKFDTSTALMFNIDSVLREATSEDTGDTEQVRKVVDDTNDKVDNALRQSETESPTDISIFGLQDADGHVIKVTVSREEAGEFENSLADLLSDNDSGKEVAEIIHILQQQFDILNVEWNDPIEGDDPLEEADETPESDTTDLELPAEETPGSSSADSTNLDLAGDELTAGESIPSTVDDASTVELLQSVINLLKQETEARAAAVAVDQAKAASELATVEHDSLNQEIAQHQEIADMEQAEDKQKEEQKNERLIARLAKYRSSTTPPEQGTPQL